MEEAFWIRQIKCGETRYLADLYERHKARLFSLCLRFTRNPSDAEEQLQEIFMRIMDKIDRFEEKSSFATWAYRLAVNHLINFKSRHAPERVGLDEAPEEQAPAGDPALRMALEKAVAALPEGFRKVFILHDSEGLKHEEIARILGCSAATSRSQLCRARLALRDQLGPLLRKEPCL